MDLSGTCKDCRAPYIFNSTTKDCRVENKRNCPGNREYFNFSGKCVTASDRNCNEYDGNGICVDCSSDVFKFNVKTQKCQSTKSNEY